MVGIILEIVTGFLAKRFRIVPDCFGPISYFTFLI